VLASRFETRSGCLEGKLHRIGRSSVPQGAGPIKKDTKGEVTHTTRWRFHVTHRPWGFTRADL